MQHTSLTKRLIVILCLLLSFAFCMTACGKKKPVEPASGSEAEQSSGGTSSSDEDGDKEEIPEVTLEINKKAVTEMSELRDYVKEDKIPTGKCYNVIRCKVSVTGTDPDGNEVKVSSSGVFKLTGLGTYTFTYVAKSPAKVESAPVTYTIVYKDPGSKVTARQDAYLWNKQQAGWPFELPKFSDLVTVEHAYAGKFTDDYVAREVTAEFTPDEGEAVQVENTGKTQRFDKEGTLNIHYSLAEADTPDAEMTTYDHEMRIEDYLDDDADFTHSDLDGYHTTVTCKYDEENRAPGMEYYLEAVADSEWGGWTWEKDSPLLQSFNHTKNSYLVLNGYNPKDTADGLFLYPGLADDGIYDGTFDDNLDPDYKDGTFKRGMQNIPQGGFKIVFARDEFANLTQFSLTFGMDWTNNYEDFTVDKSKGGKRSDTFYIKKISVIPGDDGRVKKLEGGIFSEGSVIQATGAAVEGASLTVEEGKDSLIFENTNTEIFTNVEAEKRDGVIEFDFLTDSVFKAKLDGMLNSETRGRSVLAFDVENIADEDQTTIAKAYADAFFNRVMYFNFYSDDGENSRNVSRCTLKAGEKVTINLDATTLTRNYTKGDKNSVFDCGISKFLFGAKGLCKVRLSNFRIVEIGADELV